MEEWETHVQKHLVSFCKILPVHVDKWKAILSDAVKPAQVLGNLCEQWRHLDKTKLTYIDDFEEAQMDVKSQIYVRVEEELSRLNGLIDDLHKINQDLKNKLLMFERSTLNLDWEKETMLINGNAVQPSLGRLLQDGLEFSTFFSRSAKQISAALKSLKLPDEKSVQQLQNSISDVNIEDNSIVNSLISLIQYIGNENTIS